VPTLDIQYDLSGKMSGVTIKELGPSVFSPDGKRHAFAAQLGENVVVILDGKEIFRAKTIAERDAVSLLQVHADSRHLFFYNPQRRQRAVVPA